VSRRVLRLAGIGYAVSWCVGLMVLASSTTVSSTGRELLDQFAGHSAALALQFLLTQGLAAVLLGTVLVGWCSVATAADRTRIGRAGGAAVAVSLVQCVLGLLIAWIAVPAGDPEVVGAWVAILNRLDGAKMLLLAICPRLRRAGSRRLATSMAGSALRFRRVGAPRLGGRLRVPAGRPSDGRLRLASAPACLGRRWRLRRGSGHDRGRGPDAR